MPPIVNILIHAEDDASGVIMAVGERLRGLSVAGVAAAGVAALGAAFGASVVQAASFQNQLQNVQNNTTLTNADMATMRQGVLDLGASTGASLSSLSDGFMHVMNVTGNTAASMDILKVATESAVSTGGDAAATANVLANAMHEYGADVSTASTAQGRHNEILQNASRYMGIFHLAAAEGNMTLEQFASASGRAIGVAANLHVPVEQVSAAMAALSKHGYDASEANTQVVNIMTHMINPAAAARKELERLSKATGVDLVHDFSAAGLSSKGLTGVMQDLKLAYEKSGMSEAQATQETMKLLNAQRGGLGMASLLGTAYGDYTSILGDLSNKTKVASVTADAFARSQQTVAFQWGVFKVTLQEALIAMGAPFLTAVAGMLAAGSRIVQAFGTGGVGGAFAAFRDELAKLGLLGQMASGVLGFLGRALTTLWQQGIVPAWHWLTNFAQILLTSQHPGAVFLQILKDFIPGFATLVQWLTPAVNWVRNFASILLTSQHPMATFKQVLFDLIPGLQGMVSWLRDRVPPAVAAVKGAFATAWPIIQRAVASFVDWWNGTAMPAVKKGFDWLTTIAIPAAKKAFADAWPAIKKDVSDAVKTITDSIGNLKREFGFVTSVLLPDLVTAFQKAWPENKKQVQDFISFFNGKAVPSIQHGNQDSLASFNTWAQGVAGRMTKAQDDVRAFATMLHDTIVGAVKTTLAVFEAVLVTLVAVAVTKFNAIKLTISTIMATFPGIILGIGPAAFGAAIAVGRSIINGLISSISGAAGAVASAVRGVVSGAVAAGETALSTLAGSLHIPGFGHNAAGTDNWRGGLTWVGENGPELVNLPPGAQVFNAAQSRSMAARGSGSGSGSGGVVINITNPLVLDPRHARLLAEQLAPQIRRIVSY